ncbi:MAG: hypothetical protein IJ068_00780 [Bacilli bacterium]|nr:hypothetical protein [Bacilli bacterium]
MNRKEKIERLNNLKQKYIELRKYVLYYVNALRYNNELKKSKESIKIKKLVLTKSFNGKDIVVG